MMHILLIHQAFASIDEPGGTRHHEFARFLAARGDTVTVITSPVSYLTGGLPDANSFSGNNPAEPGGVEILHARTYPAMHSSFFQRILAFVSFMVSSFFMGMRVRKVDLVWGTSPPIFQGLTAWMLARLRRVPFLFEVRDLWPDFAVAVGVLHNRTLIRLSIWLEHFLYRRADLVVVNSPGFIAHVTAGGARRVEFVPNGADPGMFTPLDRGASFRSANHLEDKFVVLYAGAHGLSNDLGVVLEAAAILQGQPATAGVTIALLGDGKEKSNLKKQAASMELANVLFLPPVPKTEMAAVLAGADACLAILKPVDEYKTTYPNKVFDYMAAGRPVVLAIDGVIREVVEAAGCGIFVQPGDPPALAEAIRSLAGDIEQARTMGLRGPGYLEQHFNRSTLAVKLVDILNGLVN
jgi:glycosyltransferase involved in cell wall biosynthesis